MSIERNKKLVLRVFDEVFNGRALSLVGEIYDPEVVDHSAFPDQAPGAKGITSAIQGLLDTVDGLTINVEDVIGEGDRGVTLENWKGTYRGTGKTVQGQVIHIFRIQNDRITDEWSRGFDWLE